MARKKRIGTVGRSRLLGARGFVPFAAADISREEVRAVARVLRSGWITTGPEVRAFEQEFAAYIGVRNAVALNSCTAALHLALAARGVGPGDEVLTTCLTFTASAEIAEYVGASSRFADVDPVTMNLAPEAVREVIKSQYRRRRKQWFHRVSGRRLRVILPVHYAGHPCDMSAFRRLANELELDLLDDAAHALPARSSGRLIGAFGGVTVFSFYATKPLTTAEGGMLVTNDAAFADRIRLLSLHGISRTAWNRYAARGSWFYEVVEAGFKYNMTDVAAAMGRVQLRRLDAMWEARRRIAAAYSREFEGIEQLETPSVVGDVQHAWHLYPLRLHLDKLRTGRARFIEEMRRRGVGASVHFIPLHLQPFYARRYGYVRGQFPVAEREYEREVSLPIFSAMRSRDVRRVVAVVAEVASKYAA